MTNTGLLQKRALVAAIVGVVGLGACWGGGGAGPVAMAQLQPSQIDRLREQRKETITDKTPLAQRLLVRTESRRWMLELEVRVPGPRLMSRDIRPEEFINPSRPNTIVNPQNPNQPLRDPMLALGNLRVVIPYVDRTSGSTPGSSGVLANVQIDGQRVNEEAGKATFTTRSGPMGSRFAEFGFPAEARGRAVEVSLRVPVSSHSLAMDPREAEKVTWPKDVNAWPAEARSALEPEFLVDWTTDKADIQKNQKAVDDLIKKWMGQEDPTKIPPIELAGRLTSLVMANFREVNSMVVKGEAALVTDFPRQEVGETIKAGRGTELHVAQVLTSVLRRVQIPARTVIGVELEDRRKNDDDGSTPRRNKIEWRAWVEFAVIDEATRTVAWLPIDMHRQRQSGSRGPGPGRPWKFLGNHEDMQYMIPVSFHQHPPLDSVEAYRVVQLWGWTGTPEVRMTGALGASVTTQSSRDRRENEGDRNR
jgi:hypothetical protein